MNPNFRHAMAEATRLMHAGDLQAATALIQATLRADGMPPAGSPFPSAWPRGDVIDIQARVVDSVASLPLPLPGGAFANPFKTSAASSATPARQASGLAASEAGPARAGNGRAAPARRRPLARPDFKALEALLPALDGRLEPFSMPVSPQVPAAKPLRPGEGRFIDGSHTEGGSTHSYRLYVSPERHGKALPLVVMLHGCTQHPDDFAAGTGMNEAACEQGFYVLSPRSPRR